MNNQENERSRQAGNAAGNQAEGNTSRETGRNDTQNPGSGKPAQANNPENQAGQQETKNSNENSASGANKGPAGSYNEKDASIGSRERREGTGRQEGYTPVAGTPDQGLED